MPASGARRWCMKSGGRPALAAGPLQQGDNAAVRRSVEMPGVTERRRSECPCADDFPCLAPQPFSWRPARAAGLRGPPRRATVRTTADRQRPARQGHEGRQDRDVDRSAVPAAVRRSSRTAPTRASTSTSGPRSPSASACAIEFADPGLEPHHRRLLGRALGLQRRLDDDHHPAREDPRLQQAVLLHAGPDGRLDGSGHHHARRPRRARRSASARRRRTSTG